VFKAHHDFFHIDQPNWELERKQGGQRSWTCMAYLNAPAAGGETAFPKAGLCFTPQPGTMLVWNNMDENGLPNDAALHEGCPVIAGAKYVLTKWFRENFWIGNVKA
jgi:prolyl 4-hydroxylase